MSESDIEQFREIARWAIKMVDDPRISPEDLLMLLDEITCLNELIEHHYVEKIVYNSLDKQWSDALADVAELATRLEDAEREVVAQKAARSAEQHGARMLVAENEALRKDAERLEHLEAEIAKETRARLHNLPFPKSLFRTNRPITREAIDAAIAAEVK